jgi:hypothetical protein
MNSLEISRILSTNYYTKKQFKGVYSSDLIPDLTEYPSLIIINTAPSGHQGLHWTLIYAESSTLVEYFDPLGNKPEGFIYKYLKRFDHITYNFCPIQPFWSNACGIYVIIYAIARCRHLNLTQTLFNLSQISPLLLENLLL